MSTTSSRAHDTIMDCLSEAQYGSHEAQLKALQTLASITKVSPQNRNLVAQSDGAISTFLNLSKSSSAAIQTLSLSVLFNLSLNPDKKHSLADTKTIHHLNSIVLDPSSCPESRKLASSLICSLAMLDRNKAKFGAAGTIESLVRALSGPRGDADHHLISTLAELVQFHGNCTLAVWAGAVEVLLEVVESPGGEELAGSSLAVLGLLARFDQGLSGLMGTEGIVRRMVEVLKGRCMLSKEGAAEILVRLFDESEDFVKDALRFSELSTVLADVSVRGSVRAREKAGLLMKKIMEVDLDSYNDGIGSPMLF